MYSTRLPYIKYTPDDSEPGRNMRACVATPAAPRAARARAPRAAIGRHRHHRRAPPRLLGWPLRLPRPLWASARRACGRPPPPRAYSQHTVLMPMYALRAAPEQRGRTAARHAIAHAPRMPLLVPVWVNLTATTRAHWLCTRCAGGIYRAKPCPQQRMPHHHHNTTRLPRSTRTPRALALATAMRPHNFNDNNIGDNINVLSGR